MPVHSVAFLYYDIIIHCDHLDDIMSGILIYISAAPANDEDELDDPYTAEGDNSQPCFEYLAITH